MWTMNGSQCATGYLWLRAIWCSAPQRAAPSKNEEGHKRHPDSLFYHDRIRDTKELSENLAAYFSDPPQRNLCHDQGMLRLGRSGAHMQPVWEGWAEATGTPASGITPIFVFMFILYSCPFMATVPAQWCPHTKRALLSWNTCYENFCWTWNPVTLWQEIPLYLSVRAKSEPLDSLNRISTIVNFNMCAAEASTSTIVNFEMAVKID